MQTLHTPMWLLQFGNRRFANILQGYFTGIGMINNRKITPIPEKYLYWL